MSDREQISGCQWLRERGGCSTKGQGSFLSGRYVLCLYCGGGYANLCMC